MNDQTTDQSAEPSGENRIVVLMQRILDMHDTDVDCESCNEQLDCLAELAASGHDPKKLLPAVQAHLDCCSDCREEFEALLCILRAQQSGQC
jgi:hypothetical protein